MDTLLKKLNFKSPAITVVLQQPDTFQETLAAMQTATQLEYDLTAITDFDFGLAFVQTQAAINALVPALAAKMQGDAILWLAYPKGTSKRYQCDFNRDTGWDILGQYGMEPVRQVAIDADWSALRFRKVAYIKTITRRSEMALTQEAKARTTAKD